MDSRYRVGLLSSLVLVLAAPAGADLISHWAFDGGLSDTGGFADNFGTFLGGEGPTFIEGVDGTPEGAILFDGVDDLVRIEHDVDGGLPIYAHPAYTVMLWVKGGLQSDKRVFSMGSSTTNTPLFNIGTHSGGANGAVDIYIRTETGTVLVNHLKSTREAFDGRWWHHIAWVDEEGDAALYIDGIKDPTNFRYAKQPIPFDRTSIAGILRASPSHWFSGSIDDVRVYDRALTEEEILQYLEGFFPCPAGDTHVAGLAVEGPEDGSPGLYTFTAEGAVDDSGDPILFTFTAESDLGDRIVVGPQDSETAQIGLWEAAWTVTVRVSADPYWWCPAPADATASVEVRPAVPVERKQLISRYTFDDTLEDSGPGGNHGTFLGLDGPTFVDDAYGNPERPCPQRVLELDGVDDLVQLAWNESLPAYGNPSFTIAFWVKGPANQADRRIFSESSTTNSSPLFNLGTDNTGTSSSFDFFLRSDANVTIRNHIHSGAAVLDDAWHHVAWSDNYGRATLFVDGEPDPAVFHYPRQPIAFDTTTIGGILRASASHWFAGRIDDFRIYSYALSQEEVAAMLAEADCPPQVLFIRGDTDGNGAYTLGDGIQILERLFAGRAAFDSNCDDTGDLDDNGEFTIGDAIWVFNYLFGEGELKRPPYPPEGSCGEDPTPETSLGCQAGIVEICR